MFVLNARWHEYKQEANRLRALVRLHFLVGHFAFFNGCLPPVHLLTV